MATYTFKMNDYDSGHQFEAENNEEILNNIKPILEQSIEYKEEGYNSGTLYHGMKYFKKIDITNENHYKLIRKKWKVHRRCGCGNCEGSRTIVYSKGDNYNCTLEQAWKIQYKSPMKKIKIWMSK